MTHKLLSVVGTLLLIITLLASGCSPNRVAPSEPAKASYLVIVVVDGCRPDYFQIADIPNIESLMEQGVTYQRAWVGQLKNNTPPVHTTISTGAFQKHHGILGFAWKDPATGEMTTPTAWDSVVSGEMTRIIVKSGVTSIGTLYRTAHPDAKVAAVSTSKFYAAAGLGAESADYILFASHYAEPTVLGEGFSTTEVRRPAGVEGHLAPDEIMNSPDLIRELKKPNSFDAWAADLAIKLVEQVKPEILLVNLPYVDGKGHQTGGITAPEEMGKAVSNADAQIGKFIELYKKIGIYDETLFVITSDHGMTPNMWRYPSELINDIKTQRLEDPAKVAEDAESIAQENIPGIWGAYYKQEADDGHFVYIPSPTTRQVITGDLDECYRYLMSTYASDMSPDVVLILAENGGFGSDPLGTHGFHRSITWLLQHVPLIISGPGVKQGVVLDSPARIVDIAPTVLTLMRIEPEGMDGIVLADALESPTPGQVETQQQVTAELAPLQIALEARSNADLAAGYDKPADE